MHLKCLEITLCVGCFQYYCLSSHEGHEVYSGIGKKRMGKMDGAKCHLSGIPIVLTTGWESKHSIHSTDERTEVLQPKSHPQNHPVGKWVDWDLCPHLWPRHPRITPATPSTNCLTIVNNFCGFPFSFCRKAPLMCFLLKRNLLMRSGNNVHRIADGHFCQGKRLQS